MHNKKVWIMVIGVIVTIVGVSSIFYINKPQKPNDTNINSKIEENIQIENETINFLKSISGLRANNLEVIDNPVGFKAELLVPKKSILNGIDYFLQDTENEKMKNINVDIGEGFIKINVDYEVVKNINTPIELKVIPSLNKNKDLVINIQEVKFIDLKIAKWIVDIGINNFIKDWFPENQDFRVAFNEGNVIIYKENFDGIYLEELLLESTGLKINTVIDLQKVMSNTTK